MIIVSIQGGAPYLKWFITPITMVYGKNTSIFLQNSYGLWFINQQLDISITMVDISNYNSNNYGSYHGLYP